MVVTSDTRGYTRGYSSDPGIGLTRRQNLEGLMDDVRRREGSCVVTAFTKKGNTRKRGGKVPEGGFQDEEIQVGYGWKKSNQITQEEEKGRVRHRARKRVMQQVLGKE